MLRGRQGAPENAAEALVDLPVDLVREGRGQESHAVSPGRTAGEPGVPQREAPHRKDLVLRPGGVAVRRGDVRMEPTHPSDEIGRNLAAPDVAPGRGEASDDR